jgi:hypothetical protein
MHVHNSRHASNIKDTITKKNSMRSRACNSRHASNSKDTITKKDSRSRRDAMPTAEQTSETSAMLSTARIIAFNDVSGNIATTLVVCQ